MSTNLVLFQYCVPECQLEELLAHMHHHRLLSLKYKFKHSLLLIKLIIVASSKSWQVVVRFESDFYFSGKTTFNVNNPLDNHQQHDFLNTDSSFYIHIYLYSKLITRDSRQMPGSLEDISSFHVLCS